MDSENLNIALANKTIAYGEIKSSPQGNWRVLQHGVGTAEHFHYVPKVLSYACISACFKNNLLSKTYLRKYSEKTRKN